MVSTLFYVVFFAVGPGSIPWMITAELFSQVDDDDNDDDDDDDDDDDAYLPAFLTQVKLKIVLLAKNGFGCALSEEEKIF